MKKVVFIFVIILFSFIQNLISEESSLQIQLQKTVESVQGIETSQEEQLIIGLLKEFNKIVEKNEKIESKYLNSIARIISAGFFEEANINTIIKVVVAVYIAEKNGAPFDETEDLATAGFAKDIRADQLEMAAKALKKFSNTNIRPEIYQEVISYCLEKDLKGKIINIMCNGIIIGYAQGLNPEKLALGIIIRIEQNLDNKNINEIVNEEINYLKKKENQKTIEEKIRDKAFQAMKNATNKGFNYEIAYEVYQISIENNWSEDITTAVFNGLIKSKETGLTPERTATALILGVEKGFEGNPEDMVNKELEFVKRKEKNLINLKDGKITEVKKSLMEESFNVFLQIPTPYKWGGMTRKGCDCSGFSSLIYMEQGKLLPRVSYEQAKTGKNVEKDDLKYGDLLFFNKLGPGSKIDHVAIYIGDNKFIHSSAGKKCVNFSNLEMKYYKIHFATARRIL